uniref:Peptidase aspartic putative domain-containing protein n=1 Tax=Trichogramma kaykai TaxID=54128 RepID=A0ABD2W4D4_9HYME
MLMCSVMHGNATAGATTNRKNEKDKKVNTPSVKNSLVTFSDMPSVCLLTLSVKLFTEDKTMIVRALYDPGSHRSYVRSEIAEKIGYQLLSRYETSHSLFGGVQAKSELYDVYRVRVRNLTNSYLCNFLALDQKVICDSVAIIEKSDWVERVKNKYGVTLSDVDSTSESIDLMIGADIAGKLITGKKIEIENGPCLFETLLGWTVMGKLPTGGYKHKNATSVLVNMFAREAYGVDTCCVGSIRVCRLTRP